GRADADRRRRESLRQGAGLPRARPGRGAGYRRADALPDGEDPAPPAGFCPAACRRSQRAGGTDAGTDVDRLGAAHPASRPVHHGKAEGARTGLLTTSGPLVGLDEPTSGPLRGTKSNQDREDTAVASSSVLQTASRPT